MTALAEAQAASADTTTLLLAAVVVVIVVGVLVAVAISARRREAPAIKQEVIEAPLKTALRILAADAATVHITVSAAGRATDLFMRDGVLYHAVSAAATGNAAAGDALRLDPSATTVTVRHDAPMPSERTVTFTLDQLMTAAGVGN